MNDLIISIFIKLDDFLQAENIEDPKKVEMYNSEILTTAIVAAYYFGNNLYLGMKYMKSNFIPKMLSKSQFIRRIHSLMPYLRRILDFLWFDLSCQNMAYSNDKPLYIVDSFPVQICEQVRMHRCKLTKGFDKKYLGYNAAKDKYFYGMKVSLMTTDTGLPIDVVIDAGSKHDIKFLEKHALGRYGDSKIIGDKAYNSDVLEEKLLANYGVELMPIRKSNYKKNE